MTDVFPKFNSNENNPFGIMDNDVGDDYSIFNFIQDDHIYVVPLSQQEPQRPASIDSCLDIEAPSKKGAEDYDTSKTIQHPTPSILQISPVSKHASALNRCYSASTESRQLQNMDVSSVEQSYDSSESSENSFQKPKRRNGKVPKARRIRSDDTHDRPHVSPKEKKVKKVKKDQRKNMYGYSFKFIVKEFLSAKYKPFFDELCVKFGVTNQAEVKAYYEEKLKWSISLKDLRSYLDYNEHGPGNSLRGVKQVFQGFYIWYMRKRYTLHILTEVKIVHKDPYLEAKNYLIYLPNIKDKCKQKRASSSDR